MGDFIGFTGISSAGTLVLIVIGALIGGFVNGLTGFGTGLSALPVWLQGLPPVLASPLVSACSVAGQLSTLKTIWSAIPWRRLMPLLIAGLAGVPIGAKLLPLIDLGAFKTGVGVLLIGYSATLLIADGRLVVGPRASDGWVEIGLGFFAGILGGIAGLSGPLMTVWAAMKGWPKEQRRGMLQGFNLPILTVALLAQWNGGAMPPGLLGTLAVALPATLIGAAIGQAVYRRLDDRRFDHVVLAILLLAGLGLLLTSR